MPKPRRQASPQSALRREAEVRLQDGSAPPTSGWPAGLDALALLHGLASNPARGAEALKLLHELQVHQVELDLQYAQLEATQRDLADDVAHYKDLYEFSPAGYLRLNTHGSILESNTAAARLLAVRPESRSSRMYGRSLESFLAPESSHTWVATLQRLRAKGQPERCQVRTGASTQARHLQILADSSPGGAAILLVLFDYSPPPPSIGLGA